MKIHDRILQNITAKSQNSSNTPKGEPFKEVLNKVLSSSPAAGQETSLPETLNEVYSLAEEVISLLEKAAKGDQLALEELLPKTRELEKLSAKLEGTAKEFLTELSLTAAVSKAKLEEGLL
ncbi:MAG TPA: hypothetical protein ENJ96_02315 [Thermodesulfatator atlanticus]|uniref:Uncharacterized protein n=1 Tax=Thermodesulfatator atlanticus TaxID=501497 RepID=A0A7V5NYY5_9BACT|nr:hypothetical protein [Thermodesulfatator atlanticus]